MSSTIIQSQQVTQYNIDGNTVDLIEKVGDMSFWKSRHNQKIYIACGVSVIFNVFIDENGKLGTGHYIE